MSSSGWINPGKSRGQGAVQCKRHCCQRPAHCVHYGGCAWLFPASNSKPCPWLIFLVFTAGGHTLKLIQKWNSITKERIKKVKMPEMASWCWKFLTEQPRNHLCWDRNLLSGLAVHGLGEPQGPGLHEIHTCNCLQPERVTDNGKVCENSHRMVFLVSLSIGKSYKTPTQETPARCVWWWNRDSLKWHPQ